MSDDIGGMIRAALAGLERAAAGVPAKDAAAAVCRALLADGALHRPGDHCDPAGCPLGVYLRRRLPPGVYFLVTTHSVVARVGEKIVKVADLPPAVKAAVGRIAGYREPGLVGEVAA